MIFRSVIEDRQRGRGATARHLLMLVETVALSVLSGPVL